MIYLIIATAITTLLASGIRIVRPTHVGLIETLGKYKVTVKSGFYWIIPVIQQMVYVDMTERMVDTRKQMVITKDNLNAEVDAVVYYKIADAQKAIYRVNMFQRQIVSLAQTTLRAVIGGMSFATANEKRKNLNKQVMKAVEDVTKTYGVDILRVEIQRIEAPNDVQAAMNAVVTAERLRIASLEEANALEIKADGVRRAAIKEAEGDAEAIKLVNESANKYFKGNAVILKKLETAEESMRENSKFIVSSEIIESALKIGKKLGVAK